MVILLCRDMVFCAVVLVVIVVKEVAVVVAVATATATVAAGPGALILILSRLFHVGKQHLRVRLCEQLAFCRRQSPRCQRQYLHNQTILEAHVLRERDYLCALIAIMAVSTLRGCAGHRYIQQQKHTGVAAYTKLFVVA